MTTRKNCLAKFLSLLLVINGVVSLAFSNTVLASNVDICVDVLDNITSPVNEYNCGSFGGFTSLPDPICSNPLCCTPGVCKVTPACGILKTIIKTIAKKGDTHCFKDVSAKWLWERWKDGQIATLIDVNTGLLPEIVLPFVKADIARIAKQANHMPKHLQESLKSIITPYYDHGKTGYSYEDIRTIKIINQGDNESTEIWLTEDKGAITLGSVIILKDEDYSQLMDPANKQTLSELLIGNLTEEYAFAFTQMVHELVHVKQYRVLGQDTFLLNYVLRFAINSIKQVGNGYGHDKFEREAYNYTSDLIELHGGGLCDKSAEDLDYFNNQYDLGRKPVECRPYIAWMIPFL